MKNITHLAQEMHHILYTRANEVARETGFMERERVLTGSSFVVGLVSAWQANPQVSLAGLSQAIGNAGTPISRQGVAERFTQAAVNFMRAMVAECLTASINGIPVSEGLLARFTCVDLVDSSVITLPNHLATVWQGSGGYGVNAAVASLKLSVRWDLRGGALKSCDLSAGITPDRSVPAHSDPVMAGSLQLRDLGYFKLDDLQRIAQQKAFWLIRYKIGTVVLDEQGQPLNLIQWLPQQVGQRLDARVQVGKRKRLPARLVAERVPLPVVQQRQQRIRETARQNQTTPSQTTLAMAHWTIYLTNVPATELSPDELFVLGRYRWQIELLFKLWKSDLGMDKWRTQNPQRLLCELYAKLIAALVTHWFLLVGCWPNPRRSLRQAMPTIHALAWQWANSLTNSQRLIHMLQALQRSLSCCHIDRSRQRPRAFQLLEAEHT
jgi:hypothetical protein